MQPATKQFYVYILVDDCGSPFYVGKGQGKRAQQHRQEAKRGHECHKCNKIRKFWKEGRDYAEQVVLRTDDEAKALEQERALIAAIGRKNLCNLTIGGEGTPIPPEVRDARDRQNDFARYIFKSVERAKKNARDDQMDIALQEFNQWLKAQRKIWKQQRKSET